MFDPDDLFPDNIILKLHQQIIDLTDDSSKVSLCLEVSHESGSLYRILSHFIYNNLNMCKIESR